jgi:hypothetical protein
MYVHKLQINLKLQYLDFSSAQRVARDIGTDVNEIHNRNFQYRGLLLLGRQIQVYSLHRLSRIIMSEGILQLILYGFAMTLTKGEITKR